MLSSHWTPTSPQLATASRGPRHHTSINPNSLHSIADDNGAGDGWQWTNLRHTWRWNFLASSSLLPSSTVCSRLHTVHLLLIRMVEPGRVQWPECDFFQWPWTWLLTYFARTDLLKADKFSRATVMMWGEQGKMWSLSRKSYCWNAPPKIIRLEASWNLVWMTNRPINIGKILTKPREIVG